MSEWRRRRPTTGYIYSPRGDRTGVPQPVIFFLFVKKRLVKKNGCFLSLCSHLSNLLAVLIFQIYNSSLAPKISGTIIFVSVKLYYKINSMIYLIMYYIY